MSAPIGAAMKNTRSLGSSSPKSTGSDRRANASVGSVTAAVRQWGIAIPPGIPVEVCASRAWASAASAWASVARPAPATMVLRASMTSPDVAPNATSRATSSGVMIDMFSPSKNVTVL